MKGNKSIQYVIVIAIIIIINIISGWYNGYIDLTEEKRYTLSKSTQQVVEDVESPIFIKVLLDGEFPAGFERLKKSTAELLSDFNEINPNIQYIFEDPLDGSPEDIKKYLEKLKKDGINSTKLEYFDGKEYVQKPIYPYALISHGGRFFAVNLLQEQVPGLSEEEILNKSAELLEYKFVNTFSKLQKDIKETIVFLAGNGELPAERTVSLETKLRQYYNTGRVNIDSIVVLDSLIDVLVIAAPTKPFDDKQKFKIDQYIMNGGKVLWLLDQFEVSLDSISKNRFSTPKPLNLNLDDLLFKYGVRINNDLLMDTQCSEIPQVEGRQGEEPQIALYPWYYHILAREASTHPIVKNIGRVNLFWPSSLETVKTEEPIKTTALLESSKYSSFQKFPMRLTFDILKNPNFAKGFDKGHKTVALLSEGKFASKYKNRITPSFQQGLDQLGITFKASSPATKQIVVTDSEFIRNAINYRTNTAERVGFNPWSKKWYEGNLLFIQNCIEYLIDDQGILESRSKEIKLRPLDGRRVESEARYWQILNVLVPLLLIALFGFGYNYWRRRKYS